ncbi:hypothetical protein LCGC14_1508090 [marine sediment metagenome]|uniref:Uncharacterized protein n=1 Tax=marine sediment metagenome TaxID=412755 RepID=A0A0F9JMY7_9ZZZZ
MATNRGGQFSAKEDHAIATEVDAYAADVAIAKADAYGRLGDGAGGAGTEALTGEVVDVLGANTILIMAKVTAAANMTGDVTFSLAVSVDGTNFSDEGNDFTTVAVVGQKDITAPADGSLAVAYKAAIVDVRGLYKVKISNIDNADAAIACTANASISKVN